MKFKAGTTPGGSPSYRCGKISVAVVPSKTGYESICLLHDVSDTNMGCETTVMAQRKVPAAYDDAVSSNTVAEWLDTSLGMLLLQLVSNNDRNVRAANMISEWAMSGEKTVVE